MVRAFASLLMRDAEGQHWLVTPECRQSIAVEDAAFVAVDMQPRDGALAFRHQHRRPGPRRPEHPLRAAAIATTPAIYLAVRHGCEARLDRSTWLQLAEHALATGDGTRSPARARVSRCAPHERAVRPPPALFDEGHGVELPGLLNQGQFAPPRSAPPRC
jgi:hypothetical protein